MGYPGQMEHPEVVAAIEKAIRRIRDAGRAPGTLATLATVDRYVDLGALYLYVNLAPLLGPGVKSFLSALKKS
jgi:4-hydroxy-2-oxoheptanedioate aldolase